MKKRYILILSIIFVILGMSCVSAADNGTDVFKEQSNDVISISDEENDNLSISENNEAIGGSNENNSTILAATNDNETLTSVNNTDVLTVSSSDSVLTSTVSVSSAYKVPTKKQRTFSIGGFKAVLSKAQYKKLFLISSIEDIWFDDGDYYTPGTKYHGYDQYNSGLRITYTIKTNKFIKIKAKMGKKTYYKKSRVYMIFSYGGGQVGVDYKYMAFLSHHYALKDLRFDKIKILGKKAKYFKKCKFSSNFSKLKNSKLYNQMSIYKKYSVF